MRFEACDCTHHAHQGQSVLLIVIKHMLDDFFSFSVILYYPSVAYVTDYVLPVTMCHICLSPCFNCFTQSTKE